MEITQKLLTPNPYSRPQLKLNMVKNIVVHWVGNAGSTAIANRNYFESLKDKKMYASAHYIIGLQGEVILCVPENEQAYHGNSANSYSIGIENCHPDWDGKFNDATYKSLIELLVELCTKYQLKPDTAIIRHYDITKKVCPKYYVEHEDAWKQLKKDVANAMSKGSSETTTTNVVDKELVDAIGKLIAGGVKLDANIWGNMNTMNMKYAKTMVERIGAALGKTTYKDTVDLLVEKGCINTRSLWDEEQFKSDWCRTLIIRVAGQLF